MALQAGFAHVDITPPVGVHKIGWIIDLEGKRVLDPLFARVAILGRARTRLAVVALDTLSVRWRLVQELRGRIEAAWGFPGDAIMVVATHNHAGPAVTSLGKVAVAEAYVAEMLGKVVTAFGQALQGCVPAEIGFGHCFEWRVAHNRRVRMRDGTTKTHGGFRDLTSLCYEGPIDPEVGVIALRRASDHAPLGCLVNFACHPTHHGGGNDFSGGYPAALCAELQAGGWPEALFLNGACGNVHDADPARGGQGLPPAEIARLLAGDVQACTAGIAYVEDLPLARRTRHISLEFRDLSDAEIRGAVPGAQRFNTNEVYDSLITNLVAKIRREGRQHAELQAFFLGDVALAAVPAEYFVEYGLDIKERTWPRRTLVVSCANGMVGYLPTREAFARGGYETTFYDGTCLAHNAGDRLTRAVIRLVNGHKPAPPADAGPAPQNAAESSE
ncbi:MAG: Neutral/alkaline non-lysosomal ceramidase [Lentisphaerae bacterium ADurb.BinA184]|nr:MAG: Neutral/alkaline non-lysosomal ceramidase [Lentisphaerae bacterium ADurb.BinA184]